MVTFLAAVGILCLTSLVIYAVVRVSETITTVDKHDDRIDDLAESIKAHGCRLESIERELIGIHQSILRIDLALKEIDEKDIADLKGAGR